MQEIAYCINSKYSSGQNKLHVFYHVVVVAFQKAAHYSNCAVKQAQQKNEVCQKVIQYCQEGWPDKSLVKGGLKQFSTWHQNFLLKMACC